MTGLSKSRKIIILLILLAITMLSSLAQNAKIDSLLQLEQQLPDDTVKANVLNKLTFEYYRTDVKKYYLYSKKALALNEQIDFKKGIIKAKNLQAIGFVMKNDFQKAAELNLEALWMAEEMDYKEYIFTTCKDLGIIYVGLGDYEQALLYSQKCLETNIQHSAISYTYTTLARIHFELGNTKEGEKYINLSIEAAKESQDPKILTSLYRDIAEYAKKNGNLGEAMNMYHKSYEYALSQNDSLFLAYNQIGMAEVYMQQGKLMDATKRLKKAQRLLKNSFEAEKIRVSVLLAEVYFRLNEYEQSAKIIHEIKNQVQKVPVLMPEIYRILAQVHASLRQFEQAFFAKSSQLRVQDSLNEFKNAQEIARLETRYQLKEKQAENEQLRQQSEAQAQELILTKDVIRQQKIITFGTIIGLLVTSSLLIYVYRLIKKLRITNQQLKKQSSDLRIARDKAESAAKAKSEFLSVMSHEIRTPMNAVIGMTHLLMDEEPRNDQMEYLDTLQFSGTNLIALINDILDFSKIEAGKLTLEQAELDLESLVKSITASTAIKGNDKGIEVKYSYDPELADLYIGDSVRLGQVLTNLMGNAVKFTEAGYVELQVAPVGENKLRFSVKDTGIGIPKDKQKQIFEAFSQAADDTTRKFGGTGLGLSISRRLVELMGGELQIESEPGEGSVFFFEIELPKSDTPKKTQSKKAESGKLSFGSLAGTRVLVAEDNKINQMVVRKFLEKWDLDITIVNNGQEAVEAWENQQFDLILMDVNMPVLNGTGATGVIRERELESQKHIPILAFTASVVEDEIKAIYDAGMDDWVGKPFEPSVLYQKIRKYTSTPIHV